MHTPSFEIYGIPDDSDGTEVMLLRSRLNFGVADYLKKTDTETLTLTITTDRNFNHNERARSANTSVDEQIGELSPIARAEQYRSIAPLYTLDRLVVTSETREQLLDCIGFFQVRSQVFETWNLKSIEPFQQVALNFHGPAGTGKTLAAHALAHQLSKRIIVASYAQVESKYHGEGPKNIEALFLAAERDGALLFLDEADSLLSKRLTNVQQGSEQAINSMRSQLLICLGQFSGIAVFATNLVTNYDTAFESRIRHVKFDLPDVDSRRSIWQKHLPAELPVSADVRAEALAEVDGVSGRDIKNAVVAAAVRVASQGRRVVELRDLRTSLETIKRSRPVSVSHRTESPLSSDQVRELEADLSSELPAAGRGNRNSSAPPARAAQAASQ